MRDELYAKDICVTLEEVRSSVSNWRKEYHQIGGQIAKICKKVENNRWPDIRF